MFQGCFKDVSRVFKESSFFSRKIEGCFNGVLSGFRACWNKVEWVFEGSFQGVSRMFQGRFKAVWRKIEGSSESPLRVIQGSFKVCKRSSKVVSRRFQRCLKEDSRVLKKVSNVFQENCIKVSMVIQASFNEVYFAILLYHESNCSYPSRRKACFIWWDNCVLF